MFEAKAVITYQISGTVINLVEPSNEHMMDVAIIVFNFLLNKITFLYSLLNVCYRILGIL